MKKSKTKSALVWIAALLSAHLAALLLFTILLSENCKLLAYERQLTVANRATFLFSIITTLLFLLFFHKTSFALLDQRAKHRMERKQQSGSLMRYFFTCHAKRILCRTLSFALLQIPFVIFYAKNSFSYIRASVLEQFYIMDVGFYLAARSPIWGYLISVAYFMLLDAAILYLCLLGVESEQKHSHHQHRHRHHHG